MPLGMTGFGRATAAHELGAVTVEVKSVNNRFLKVSTRLPDVFSELETFVEARVRKALARGSVYCQVQFERARPGVNFRLNEPVIRDWLPRLVKLAEELGEKPPKLKDVLAMDGVVIEETERLEPDETLTNVVLTCVDDALAALVEMRAEEGRALAKDVSGRVKAVAEHSKQVEARAPQVVAEYRDKLMARLERLLQGTEVKIEENDLVKEVAYFADRCDVTEETTRMAHHCGQFLDVIGGKGEVGRRLDFIAQEMLREANTIASKANDAELAATAVAMKSEIEKIKEQVQNLE